MTALAVLNPFPQFFDLEGDPLDSGRIYFGVVNQNPITSPVPAYWNSALTQQVAQPARTRDGYIFRQGSPALVYIDGAYSILVHDKRGRQVLYAPNSAEFGNSTVILGLVNQLKADLADTSSTVLGDAMLGVLQPGAGATPRTQHSKNADHIDVTDFGAVGDGVADDTSALDTAEAAAFILGRPLMLPEGKTFTHSNSWACRVSVVGYGAKLKSTAPSENLTAGLLHFANVTGISVRGLTIDGSSRRRALLVMTGSRLTLSDLFVQNALFGGVAVYNGNDVAVTNCRVDGCIYVAAGTGAADGFYFDSSTNVRVLNCQASNFERIGFVTEGQVGVGTKCDNIVLTNCVSATAKNCDRSTTEFNAAFWHENTNNISYVNCFGINIASGVGQTSGRVRGFQSAVGASAVSQVNYVNCQITGNTNSIPFGFVCQGTGQLPSVNYENCFVQKCAVGMTSIGGIDTLAVKNFKADLVVAANGQGAIVFDIASSLINEISIDGIAVTNRTYAADAADINFFSVSAATRYRLTGARFCTHIMRGAIASATVDNSIIEYGSATYASFSASEIRLKSGFVGFLRSGAVKRNIWEGFQMTGGTVYMDGCRIASTTNTQVQQACGGTSVSVYATGCVFDYVNFFMNIDGTFSHVFTGCVMLHCDATTGFYLSNALAPTRQLLQVVGCRLEGVSAGATPLRKSTNNPTATILQSNSYSTTNLHDFTAGVTQANNTAF